jgi:hypothetical protein
MKARNRKNVTIDTPLGGLHTLKPPTEGAQGADLIQQGADLMQQGADLMQQGADCSVLYV